MNRPKRSTVAVAVVVVVVASCGIGMGRWLTGCHSSPERVEMIEQFRADPLFAAASLDGQFVEGSTGGLCSSGGGSPLTGPWGRWVYRTTAVYELDQLRVRLARPATAAGWSEFGDDGEQFIMFCKRVGDYYAFAATVTSSNTTKSATGTDVDAGVVVSFFAQSSCLP